MVGEVGSEDLDLLKEYCGKDTLDVVFNFNLGSMKTFDVKEIFQQFKKMESTYTNDQFPTLFFSSHDMSRHFSRFGENEELAKMIAILMLTGKGIPFLYYGDEIGMKDYSSSDISMIHDVQGRYAYNLALRAGQLEKDALQIANEKSRDKSRSPMQWNKDKNAGFSIEVPWLPTPELPQYVNVQEQQQIKDSLWSFYQNLISIRNSWSVLQMGNYEVLKLQEEMIVYIRSHRCSRMLVALNFGSNPQSLSWEGKGQLILSNKRSELIETSVLTLDSYEGILIQLEDSKL